MKTRRNIEALNVAEMLQARPLREVTAALEFQGEEAVAKLSHALRLIESARPAKPDPRGERTDEEMAGEVER